MLHEPDGHKRKNLAIALRDLRKAAGLSGERLAARCQISQSKISRIESGKTLPTVADTERILRALDVPREIADELLVLARAANVDYSSWRSVARLGIWHKQVEIKALAEDSSVVRQFLPAMLSGLLQTPDYATETLTPRVEGRPALDVERAVAARVASQEALDDETRQFVFLLTEPALLWQQADPPTMTKQFEHLVEVSRRPNIDLAVIPLSSLVKVPPLNIFVVYDERLVIVETFSGEIALRDPRDISYHLNLFQYFHAHALTGDDGRSRIMRELG